MLSRWDWPLDRRRRRYRAMCRGDAMKAYLDTPTPRANTPYDSAEFIVVDLETTGLEPLKDEIVSIGWVLVTRSRVLLASASHIVIRTGNPMNQSAIVHGLRDSDLAAGAPLSQALDEFLSALAGRVLVAHHAPLDCSFLDRACTKIYGVPLLTRCVDTLELEKRRRAHRNQSFSSGALRLGALRDHYGLPRVRAHNALADAIATAELLLVMARRRQGRGKIALAQILT
jgi:DNA polymerase-3 subunit epsilon